MCVGEGEGGEGGGDFCVCDRFVVVAVVVVVFNPTIEAVTFRLHGWCMLSAFCCRYSPI